MGLSTVLVGCLPRFATIGWAAPIDPGAAAPAAGPGAGRRVRRRRDLRRRARAREAARLRHQLDPDHGDHRLLPVADRHPGVPQVDVEGGVHRLGLAHSVPGVGVPAAVLALPPAQARRVAGLPQDQGGGQDHARRRSPRPSASGATSRSCILALLGATAGQGVVWYTGQFYALFFLQITLKVDYEIAYVAHRGLAGRRHRRSSSSSAGCPIASAARRSSWRAACWPR